MSERTLTITWADPVAAAAAGAQLSGLDYLTAMANGRLPPPPIAALMGMDAVEVTEGRVVFAAEPGEHHYNPIGVVHGGLALTMLDSAMGCAVHSTLLAGTRYTSLEAKVNFVRSLRAGEGRVRAEGTVVHRGRKVATAEGRIVRERDGKLLAHGTTTCLVLEPQ